MHQKTVPEEVVKMAAGGDLIIAEEVEKGSVTLEDVNAYLAYSYGGWSYTWYFVFSAVSGTLQLYTTYFVAQWAEQDAETQQ